MSVMCSGVPAVGQQVTWRRYRTGDGREYMLEVMKGGSFTRTFYDGEGVWLQHIQRMIEAYASRIFLHCEMWDTVFDRKTILV